MWKRLDSIMNRQVIWIATISILSILGIGIVIYSTVWGAALTDDSYYYISSARNLLAGKGFELIPYFPPLLSLLLSLIGLAKVDPLISIRWVNAMLFALNIYLVARIVFILTHSRLFSLLSGIIALLSSTLIMVHSAAMSEALFLSLALLGVMFFALGDENDTNRAPLLTGIFFGLAAATRYIGIALLIAGGVYWLFEKGRKFQVRLRNAFIFSLVGIIPLGLWAIRNEILIGQPTNRSFAIHLIPGSSWVNMLNTIFLWFIPGRFVHGKEILWLAGGALVAFGWWIVNQWQKRRTGISTDKESHQKTIHFILLAILSYLVVLVISRSFFDERIPMDERLLSPIFAMGLILLLWFFSRQWKAQKWYEMGVIVILILAVLVTNGTRSIQMVQSYHSQGRGYASARDHISETYTYLRNRPSTPIYSNAFAAIYFWTGRVTYSIPPTANLPAMKEDMQKTGALLVVFDSIPVELYGTTQSQLVQGLVEQIQLSEATIYRSP